MRRVGFTKRWITLLMLCVKTVSYSILVKGEPKGLTYPSRAIRQGDPLSPFLFLLCMEGLNGLINKAADKGDIKGYALCRNNPRLTHLLFADDSLLFCRATIQECQHVLNILETYDHPRIEAQVVPGFEDMKVSALIDPATKKWDFNMLNGLFTTQEVELISSIPLCPNVVEDVVVWHFTPSGTYTMRSDAKHPLPGFEPGKTG
ncbi:hypothetical protein SO802_024844 [Lithocarpus litseifolius]|uniref:Reverse transcriptase domain-containing protein n=1 Tax=Lithocarpus litseifolius TaxID=425828 RepID=A0AAW2CBI1_9ROSI